MAKRLTDERIDIIAENYVTNGCNKSKALQAAGYSKSYSEHNGRYLFNKDKVTKAIAAKRAEIQAESKDKLALIRQEHLRLSILAEQKGDLVNATRNLEGYGKTYGAYMDVVKDATEQQKELNEAEQAEARRLVDLRLKDVG